MFQVHSPIDYFWVGVGAPFSLRSLATMWNLKLMRENLPFFCQRRVCSWCASWYSWSFRLPCTSRAAFVPRYWHQAGQPFVQCYGQPVPAGRNLWTKPDACLYSDGEWQSMSMSRWMVPMHEVLFLGSPHKYFLQICRFLLHFYCFSTLCLVSSSSASVFFYGTDVLWFLGTTLLYYLLPYSFSYFRASTWCPIKIKQKHIATIPFPSQPLTPNEGFGKLEWPNWGWWQAAQSQESACTIYSNTNAMCCRYSNSV